MSDEALQQADTEHRVEQYHNKCVKLLNRKPLGSIWNISF